MFGFKQRVERALAGASNTEGENGEGEGDEGGGGA